MSSNYPSKWLESAIEAFSSLPGIGRKTAIRLALHILDADKSFARNFGESIINLRENIKYCKKCHNISDEDICSICSDRSRDHLVLCVVQDMRDVMAIEATSQFRGLYHVLGGLISPMDGIGPEDLNIDSLKDRVNDDEIEELIFALNTTMEGETTRFYIARHIDNNTLKLSNISRGVTVGSELEYADEISLGRSILERVPYQK